MMVRVREGACVYLPARLCEKGEGAHHKHAPDKNARGGTLVVVGVGMGSGYGCRARARCAGYGGLISASPLLTEIPNNHDRKSVGGPFGDLQATQWI